MKVTPTLQVPVLKNHSTPPFGSQASTAPTILACTFHLIQGPLSDHFYECEHCRGAGLECFDRRFTTIPDEIEEAMHTHAQLCEGIWVKPPTAKL